MLLPFSVSQVFSSFFLSSAADFNSHLSLHCFLNRRCAAGEIPVSIFSTQSILPSFLLGTSVCCLMASFFNIYLTHLVSLQYMTFTATATCGCLKLLFSLVFIYLFDLSHALVANFLFVDSDLLLSFMSPHYILFHVL